MANNQAVSTALKLIREFEQQARKTMREPGDSHQQITIRAHIHIKQDKAGKIQVGGEIATNLPTEPVAGSIGGDWEMTNTVGVIGYVEVEKVIVLDG